VAGKVKPWIWVVLGVVVVVVLGIVAVAGVGFYFLSRNIQTETASTTGAAQEFEQVRNRFAGDEPLIELDDRGRVLGARTGRAAAPGAPTPSHLHLLAFDPANQRIVRFRLPFWMLRLRPGATTIDLNGERLNLADLRLSIEDLERYGPSLLLDHQADDGERVLVWTQ
jgi:hypothetical protein